MSSCMLCVFPCACTFVPVCVQMCLCTVLYVCVCVRMYFVPHVHVHVFGVGTCVFFLVVGDLPAY